MLDIDEAHYDRMVELADRLIEQGAGEKSHPLHDLWLLLANLIYSYDQQHYPLPDLSGIDMLQFFMNQHELTPSNFPEIGDQQIVAELLQGKRELNMCQIKALSARFGVSPAVFL